MLAMLMLLLASCVDGYDDDQTFSPGVTDTQLESPDASKITVTTVINSTQEEELKIEWPVVMGAGGYQFTLYNVDDPDNPVVVGEENEIVDGCSVQRPKQEDTKYKIVILTLGNEKYNNKTATSSSEKEYTTLVRSVGTIPAGSDLADYFEANPIEANVEEVAYELEAGGHYTLSRPLDFGLNWITLRGDKIDHATVTYGADGRIGTNAGLKLKFIDFDCSAVPEGSDAAFILLSKTPDESIKGTGDYYIIENDVAVQSCNIKGINKYLIYDNNTKYCIKTFRIQDCIVSLNTTSEVLFFQSGFINNLTFSQSTLYGVVESSTYLIKYNNSGRPDRAGFQNGSINFYNSTLYNISKNGQMANYPGMSRTAVTLSLNQNLFVNCGKKDVVRRLAAGTSMTRSIANNCYWYEGGFAENEEMGGTQGDNSNANKAPATGFYEVPDFAGPIDNPDPLNVNFTPSGSEISKRSVGDPRWLPVTE